MTEVHQDPLDAAPSSDAASMGAELRALREARGETAGDVAHALKLTSRQIEAMEAGRLDLLPGPAFARGFLRNYARYLGVDPAVVVSAFEADANARAVELLPLSNAEGVMPSGGARTVRLPLGLIVGILLLIVFVGWYFDWFQVPSDPAQLSESPVEAVPQGGVAITGPAAAPSGQVSESALAASGVVPSIPADAAPSLPPAAPLSAPLPAPAAAGTVPPAATPVPATPDTAAPEAPRAPGVEHIVFRFEGESWVEVRDASGAIVHSGVNAAGSTRTVQGKPPFALVVGNAKQVAIDYRGKPYDLKPYVRVSVARFSLE